MDDRKTPTAGFWTAVIFGVLVCYVLGLGPACWLSSRFGGEKVVTVAYRPLTNVAWVIDGDDSDALMDATQWYSGLAASQFHKWTFSPDAPGHAKWGRPLYFDIVDYNHNGDGEFTMAPDEPPESPSPP